MTLERTMAAMVAALIVVGCSRSEAPPTNANANVGMRNAAAPADNRAGSKPAGNDQGADAEAEEEEEASEDLAQPAHEDRSGPTRNAACEINDERAVACSFTPVLNDGSFDIDTPDRQLRVLVSGREAAVYERIGNRRIPLPGTLFRDPGDEACWVVEEGDADAPVTRVCAR